MSLVNDVLRDLERNRLKERDIAQLVSAYKAPLENQPGMSGRRYLWPVIATLLVIAGYYSLRYYQSWQDEEFERLRPPPLRLQVPCLRRSLPYPRSDPTPQWLT